MKVLISILIFLLVALGTLVAVVKINQIKFLTLARDHARHAFAQRQTPSDSVITEAQLAGLPAPVQRYLTYAGVIGKKPVSTVRLKMQGDFRTSPEQDFFDIHAEEYYTMSPPSLFWHGEMKMAPFVTVAANDTYADGRGNMWIKLLSTFIIENATGEHMNDATLMRYLNEMVWFPTAYLGDNVSWEPIDEFSARVSITDHGRTASAEVFFNEQGQMINFKAPRFCSPTQKLETWTTPFWNYKEKSGFHIPTGGEGVWKLETGDFAYIRLTVTDIEYDVNETY